MMATVAKNLSDDEIQSLGSYLQGLHAAAKPAPTRSRAAKAMPAPAAPAAPAPAAPPRRDAAAQRLRNFPRRSAVEPSQPLNLRRYRPCTGIFLPILPVTTLSSLLRHDRILLSLLFACSCRCRVRAVAGAGRGRGLRRHRRRPAVSPLQGKIEVVEVFAYSCPHCAGVPAQARCVAAQAAARCPLHLCSVGR